MPKTTKVSADVFEAMLQIADREGVRPFVEADDAGTPGAMQYFVYKGTEYATPLRGVQ